VPKAVNCWVVPTPIVGFNGDTAIETREGGGVIPMPESDTTWPVEPKMVVFVRLLSPGPALSANASPPENGPVLPGSNCTLNVQDCVGLIARGLGSGVGSVTPLQTTGL